MGLLAVAAGGFVSTILIFGLVMGFNLKGGYRRSVGTPIGRVAKVAFITFLIILVLRLFGGGFNLLNIIETILHIPGIIICAAVAGYWLRRQETKQRAEGQ